MTTSLVESGLSDITGDQSRSVNFHEMSLRENAKRPIGAREEPGDRCLTGARIAGKNQMERQSFGVEVMVLPELSNAQ